MSTSHAEACNRLCRGCGEKIKLKKLFAAPYLVPDIHHSVPLDNKLVTLAASNLELSWSEDKGDDSIEPRRICTSCRNLLIYEAKCMPYAKKSFLSVRPHNPDSCEVCESVFSKGWPGKRKKSAGKKYPPLKYVKVCVQCCRETRRGLKV